MRVVFEMEVAMSYIYRVYPQPVNFSFVEYQIKAWKDDGHQVELLDRNGKWYVIKWLDDPFGIDGNPAEHDGGQPA